MLPHGRLPSNSCIGRAPPAFPSPPAHLLRGPSDTALAFLGSFRIATTLIRCGNNEVPELDVAGRGEGVTLPVLSSANENRRTCEACRCERAGCSLLRTAPPDAYPTPNARGISHLQRTRP